MRFSLYKTFALSLALIASVSAISLQEAPPAVINPTDQPGDIHNKVEAAVGSTAKVVKISGGRATVKAGPVLPIDEAVENGKKAVEKKKVTEAKAEAKNEAAAKAKSEATGSCDDA